MAALETTAYSGRTPRTERAGWTIRWRAALDRLERETKTSGAAGAADGGSAELVGERTSAPPLVIATSTVAGPVSATSTAEGTTFAISFGPENIVTAMAIIIVVGKPVVPDRRAGRHRLDRRVFTADSLDRLATGHAGCRGRPDPELSPVRRIDNIADGHVGSLSTSSRTAVPRVRIGCRVTSLTRG